MKKILIKLLNLSLISTRFSIKEQAHFAKRLSFLVRAGVPVVDGLRMMRRGIRSKSKVKIYDLLITDLSNGQFLATSLSKLKNTFGNFAVNIIRTGETSGMLDQNLDYLAEELRKRVVLRQKIIGAFIYPIFITVATLALTGILTAFIFPKIRPIFNSLHVALPASTRFLIFVSDFLREYGSFIFAGALCALVVSTVLIKKVKAVGFFIDYSILKLPFIGNIFKSYMLANFCRTLGLLLKGGVRITEAITITGETMSNMVYKKEIIGLAGGILKGENISHYLEKRQDLFPDTLSQMVLIGESTGNLSESLHYLSEMYEAQVDDLTKNLGSVIEPALMIFMGLIVGLVAVSVITPIYEITQNLHR